MIVPVVIDGIFQGVRFPNEKEAYNFMYGRKETLPDDLFYERCTETEAEQKLQEFKDNMKTGVYLHSWDGGCGLRWATVSSYVLLEDEVTLAL